MGAALHSDLHLGEGLMGFSVEEDALDLLGMEKDDPKMGQQKKSKA